MFRIFKTHIENAMESLGANRMRTFLTMLGVMIGIASITAIFSLSGGVASMISKQIANQGAMLVVRPQEISNKNKNLISSLTSSNNFIKSSLTEKDLETVSKTSNILVSAPLATFSSEIKTDKNTIAAPILATTSNFEKTINLKVRDGEFIADSSNSKNAVIGYNFAIDIFGTPDAIGRNLKIRGENFLVIGILDKQDSEINFNNIDFNNSVIINYFTAKNMIGETLHIEQINAKATSTNHLNSVDSKISEEILKNHKGEKDFEVLSGEEIAKSSNHLVETAGIILAVVAGISLVVGGIGIMNIMLVNVSERTREIGIRKALGANSRHILAQFLTESVIISLGGGLFGFILGYAFSFGISLALPFSPAISNDIALLIISISIGVGVIFGIYPALRASRKDPIESLRHYN